MHEILLQVMKILYCKSTKVGTSKYADVKGTAVAMIEVSANDMVEEF